MWPVRACRCQDLKLTDQERQRDVPLERDDLRGLVRHRLGLLAKRAGAAVSAWPAHVVVVPGRGRTARK